MSSPPLTLSTLNVDVTLEILRFLSPADIANVGNTCKALHSATLRRILWIEALATVVHDNDLYTQTYDVESMSDAQLERSALFPTRLLRLAEKQCDSFLQPKLHRVLVNNFDQEEKEVRIRDTAHILSSQGRFKDFSSFSMVPGGRFLFTTSKWYRSMKSDVKLWDLGAPGGGNSMTKHLSTTTFTLENTTTTISIAATAPTLDGLGIILALDIHRERPILSVYEIYPLSPTPMFTEIASIDVYSPQYRLCTVCPQDNRIICALQTVPDDQDQGPASSPTLQMFIWDYVRNLSTTLCVYNGTLFDFYSFGDYIVTLSDGFLELYAIPPLGGQRRVIYTREPANEIWSRRLSYVEPKLKTRQLECPMTHQLSWMRHPNHTLSAYIYSEGGLSDHWKQLPSRIMAFGIDHSWIPVNSDSPVDFPPTIIETSVLATLNHRPGGKYRKPLPNAIQKCSDRLVLSFEVDNLIMLVVAPIPGSGQYEGDMGVISTPGEQCFIDTGNFQIGDVEFCAVTGRACALGRNGEIRILDYHV